MTRPRIPIIRNFVLLTLILVGCKEEKVPKRFYPRNDHEAYWHSLKLARLDETALGKDWISAANSAFSHPIKSILPYLEAFHLDPGTPEALTYRFMARRGQRVSISATPLAEDSSRLFIDVYRVLNDSLKQFRHIATADSSFLLAFEARGDYEYLLRIQPELLRGGNYRLKISAGPSFQFPVAGKNRRAIQSFFGDPRDGGRREHHGVDIFAKRHTPIVAPCDGYIRFVGIRGLGGKVIWMRESKNYDNLYFAHLDSQWVRTGAYVKAGDTLGTVGNTGNARFTPPHLHFGIYNNGPKDPFYFIAETSQESKRLAPITDFLGTTQSTMDALVITSEPSNKSQVMDTLAKNDRVKITGLIGNTLRLKTLNGQIGYLQGYRSLSIVNGDD